MGKEGLYALEYSQNAEMHEDKTGEEVEWLEIGTRFWSLLEQRVGIRDVGSVDLIKVVFKSESDAFLKARERLLRSGVATEDDIDSYVIGKFFLETESIEFNIGLDEIRALGVDPDELVLHELVHLAQDMGDKYPEMRMRIRSGGHDKDSPWEKEAYRLQKTMLNDFKKYCTWDRDVE